MSNGRGRMENLHPSLLVEFLICSLSFRILHLSRQFQTDNLELKQRNKQLKGTSFASAEGKAWLLRVSQSPGDEYREGGREGADSHTCNPILAAHGGACAYFIPVLFTGKAFKLHIARLQMHLTSHLLQCSQRKCVFWRRSSGGLESG